MNTRIFYLCALLSALLLGGYASGQTTNCGNGNAAAASNDASSDQCNKNAGAGNPRRGQGHGREGGNNRQRMNMSHDRHHFVRNNGIPADYEEMTNPLQANTENSAAGETVYTQNCASCHGATGVGDGEAGVNLSPAPTNIARFAQMRMASDAYLFWTVSEGGQVVESAMPPFKEVLTDKQIWQAIVYLKGLAANN